MKLIKISIILVFSAMFLSCGENNTCGQDAKIIYNLGFTDCEFFIEINGDVYEPTNISQWNDYIFYLDTQYVSIDYQFTNEFSNCGAIRKIEIFCLNNM
jgi:hypothetical protein